MDKTAIQPNYSKKRINLIIFSALLGKIYLKSFFVSNSRLLVIFKTSCSKFFFFEPPTVNEIIACIGSLNTNKAVGYDNIPAYFLKVAAPNIAPYQCFLIDYAFFNGIFPGNCKITNVIPIHKKGKKDNPSNFRPI